MYIYIYMYRLATINLTVSRSLDRDFIVALTQVLMRNPCVVGLVAILTVAHIRIYTLYTHADTCM